MLTWVRRSGRDFSWLLLAVSLLAACGPTATKVSEHSTAALDVVPWADIPAPNLARPYTVTGVAPCRAADLNVSVHAPPGSVDQGPYKTSTWAVIMRNQAAIPCFVGSSFDVTFTGANGPLRLTQERLGGHVIYLAPRGSGPIDSPYWSQAIGEIDTNPCPIPAVVKMTISPGPSLGSVTIDPGPAGGWGPVCPATNLQYLAELRPDCSLRQKSCIGYAANTETSMTTPTSVKPGQLVRFTISITNQPSERFGLGGVPSPSGPVSFANCPSYHEELEGVFGTFHTYRLNCARAQPIAPMASETFEMYIRVPPDAHPGPSVLAWGLDESPTLYQPYFQSIEVVP